MTNPLVSIIVPAYNTEKYLSKCLDSILAQTVNDFECLVVNDGSTDSTATVCEAYAAADNRVKVLTQKNAGMGAARNAALDVARGKYVSFVDSDDTVSPDFLENVRWMESDASVSLVRIPVAVVDEDGKLLRTEDEEEGMVSTKEEIYTRWLTSVGVRGYVWQNIYRRELFEGVRFAPIVFEDCHIIGDILKGCTKVCLSRTGSYRYLQRMSSITHTGWTNVKVDGDMKATVHYLECVRPCIGRTPAYMKVFERFVSRAFTHQRNWNGVDWTGYYRRMDKITPPYRQYSSPGFRLCRNASYYSTAS